MALLKQVIADHPSTPAAAVAEYDLIAFDLDQNVDADRVAALAKWVTDHPKHARVGQARRRLVEAHLALADRAGTPPRDAKLFPTDEAALSVATEIYKQAVRADRALALTQQIVTHLDKHYAQAGAFGAAAQGSDRCSSAAAPVQPGGRAAGGGAVPRGTGAQATVRPGDGRQGAGRPAAAAAGGRAGAVRHDQQGIPLRAGVEGAGRLRRASARSGRPPLGRPR